MNAIFLPAGTTHVQFDDLPYLIADALFPDTGPDDGRLRAGYALANIGEELDMDARLGKLLLRNELTLGPHQVPKGEAIVNALVAVDDLRDYVEDRKLTVIVDAPESAAPPVVAETPAVPVVDERASGGLPVEHAGQGWRPKSSIERAPGYRWPLYQVLRDAHTAGKPCPKAREVLDIWREKPPPEVQVMSDGVKYNDGLGNPKEADLKAIQQAIKNLLE